MWALLESTGCRTGRKRQVPVGNGLIGSTFWLFAEYGARAGYVRNIEANPRVRVKVGTRWYTGTAQLLPQDDSRRRQRELFRSPTQRVNAWLVSTLGTDLLTIRIDLD